MDKTPFIKLKSEDILSAHISGLGSAINNLEEILEMKTKTISEFRLEPVIDNENPVDNYRIYEGDTRCWLNSPPPVIKRNREIVSQSEYSIQPAYGVVVFHVPQNMEDTITVNVTCIANKSKLVEKIESKMNESDIVVPPMITRYDKTKLCPTISGYLPKQLCDNGGSGIGTASKAMESFPLICPEDCEIDKATYKLASTTSGGSVIIGIYDSEDGSPSKLIDNTNKIDCGSSREISGSFKKGNVKLKKGRLYYLSVYYSTALNVIGVHHSQCLEIEPEKDKRNCSGSDGLTTKQVIECKAIRVTSTVLGSIDRDLPSIHPTSRGQSVSDFMYLGRLGYCVPALNIVR